MQEVNINTVCTALYQFYKAARELKRGLAVSMTLRGYTHAEIIKTLQVSSGFISKWKQAFIRKGVEGIKLGYQGSLGYLNERQKQQVIDWLKSQNYWDINQLECYIAEKFDVTYAAKSSYYDLFSEAGISWKKSPKKNSRKNPELVDEKKAVRPGGCFIRQGTRTKRRDKRVAG